MAGNSGVDAAEQIDIDGDNEIEDARVNEDIVDDDGCRKERGEYTDDEHSLDNDNYRKVSGESREEDEHGSEGDDFLKIRDEYGDEEHGSEEDEYRSDDYREEEHHFDGERQVNSYSPDTVSGDLSSRRGEENSFGPMEEADNQEHAKLLALPPHGSEIFIGGLPRDATEEDLEELCNPCGEIFEVRLSKDKENKESKGFAFVTFTTKEAAQKAIEDIHEKVFQERTLRCSLSQAKYRLFIGNVPKSYSEEALRKILKANGPGLEHIECPKDAQNPNRNRGFLFVEYYNHACADYARQKMSSADFKIDGTNPTVSWAESKNAHDASAVTQVKAIYVKHLPESVTSEKLKELFQQHGEVTRVVLPTPKAGQGKRDFGFVHFAERSSALKAVKGTQKYEIDGHAIEVSLAKPQSEKKFDNARSGPFPHYQQHPAYGYSGEPYGAYGSGYGAAGFGEPVIYGRGPTPSGMRMVPMVLPDGRLGYVLQQPGVQAPPPPPPRRGGRTGASRESGSRSNDRVRGRRYRPY